MTETDPRGPWVAAAVLCQDVLQEGDGKQSLIRIVDRFTVTAGPNAPEEMPASQVPIKAFILLKAGAALGSHKVRLRPEKPSGLRLAATDLPVYFEAGQDHGVALTVDVRLDMDEEGLWWFDVLFDENDKPLTRVPLRLIYQRLSFGQVSR